LEGQRNDTSPVDDETRGEICSHVVPADVVNNKWEPVKKCKDEEGTRDPPLKTLKPLVGVNKVIQLAFVAVALEFISTVE
jgi:hypothetical protein